MAVILNYAFLSFLCSDSHLLCSVCVALQSYDFTDCKLHFHITNINNILYTIYTALDVLVLCLCSFIRWTKHLGCSPIHLVLIKLFLVIFHLSTMPFRIVLDFSWIKKSYYYFSWIFFIVIYLVTTQLYKFLVIWNFSNIAIHHK